jgi:hypothetical protein
LKLKNNVDGMGNYSIKKCGMESEVSVSESSKLKFKIKFYNRKKNKIYKSGNKERRINEKKGEIKKL